MLSKKDLKAMIKHAYKMKAQTHETEVVFNMYANGLYILDTEEDDVIDICYSREEAIEWMKGMDEQNKIEGGVNDCYYKPILIDADSGERVTRANFQYYDLKSEWVKTHIKEMEAYLYS